MNAVLNEQSSAGMTMGTCGHTWFGFGPCPHCASVKLMYPDPNAIKRPYLCPVCNGACQVNRALYGETSSTSGNMTTCKSCNGSGVLWG